MINYTNSDYEFLMKHSGFPKRYISAKSSDIDNELFSKCKPVLENYRSLFLLGEAGTGKTYLSAAIARTLLEQHCMEDETTESHSENKLSKIRYVDIITMLNTLRSSYDNKDVSSSDIIDSATNARYLVLDDIGAERISEWTLDILYTIVNKRYGDMKATIFISNKSLSEIQLTLGNRITSRMSEICTTIKFSEKRKRRI